MLERLGRLRDAGALSEEEFEAQKADLLSTSPVQQVPANAANAEPGVHPTPNQPRHQPTWDRPKRRASVPAALWMILAVLVVGVGAATIWPMATEDEFSFLVTGTANVRNAPTSEGSDIIGQLAQGEAIFGQLRGSGETQWVEITEGPFAGGFVWEGNLVSEGPDDLLGRGPDNSSQLIEANADQGSWIRGARAEPQGVQTFTAELGDEDQIRRVCTRIAGHTGEGGATMMIAALGRLAEPQHQSVYLEGGLSYRAELTGGDCMMNVRLQGEYAGRQIEESGYCAVTIMDINAAGTPLVVLCESAP